MSQPGQEGFLLLKVNNQRICHNFENWPQVWNSPHILAYRFNVIWHIILIFWGCIFLAATIGPFLSAALYSASGDLAVWMRRVCSIGMANTWGWGFVEDKTMMDADEDFFTLYQVFIVQYWMANTWGWDKDCDGCGWGLWIFSNLYQVFIVHGLCHVANLLYCLRLPEPRSTKAETPSLRKLISLSHFK